MAWIALALVLLAILGALLAGFGTGEGWWSYARGLAALTPVFAVAVIATFLGVYARVFRKGGKGVSLVALLLGLALAAYLGNFARVAASVPAIHDVTTDLADPPAFRDLPLRADNLQRIPSTKRPGWAALTPYDRWKAIHADAYPDLHSATLAMPPAAALKKAEDVARSSGWRIAAVDAAAGQLEATATTRFFRFKDDVVIRVRPAGGGSIVDMRSVSRVGVSDLGANAQRIRSFLKQFRT
jgi:uncharacterized protein (DUF1499 family)